MNEPKLSLLEIARQKACGEMPCDAGCGEGGHVKACERVAEAVMAELRAMLHERRGVAEDEIDVLFAEPEIIEGPDAPRGLGLKRLADRFTEPLAAESTETPTCGDDRPHGEHEWESLHNDPITLRCPGVPASAPTCNHLVPDGYVKCGLPVPCKHHAASAQPAADFDAWWATNFVGPENVVSRWGRELCLYTWKAALAYRQPDTVPKDALRALRDKWRWVGSLPDPQVSEDARRARNACADELDTRIGDSHA